MDTPIEWKDEYFISPERKVLTSEQLQIPGLQLFGKHTMSTAVDALPWHYHNDSFEFVYTSKGEISFSTETKTYKVGGGNTFIAHPGEIHSTNYIPLSVGEIYWFQLNLSDMTNLLFLSSDAASVLVQGLKSLPHHTVNTAKDEMHTILKKAFQLCLNSGSQYLAATYITLFLQRLVECSKTTLFTLTPDIGRSINYILDHIDEALSLEELAEFCHLSTSQYKQKFKKQMGTSPRTFINAQKVEAAKHLLAEGYDMTEVAMNLGFSSSSYFSTTFKRYTTFSPREYMKRHFF